MAPLFPPGIFRRLPLDDPAVRTAPTPLPRPCAGNHQLPHDSRRDRLIDAPECDFIPRHVSADAQSQGSGALDHEREIPLAIQAAIPDLIIDTNRHVIRAASGCLMALASRFEWNSRAKPV